MRVAIFLLLLLVGVASADDLDRYTGMADHPMFNLAEPTPPPAPTPSPTSPLYFAGANRVDDEDVAIIRSYADPRQVDYLYVGVTNHRGLTLVRIDWSEDYGQTTATIQLPDGETICLPLEIKPSTE